MLYNLFNSGVSILPSENIMFESLPNSNSLTAYKSVPLSSIGWVCNTKAILSAFSLGKVSKNNL